LDDNIYLTASGLDQEPCWCLGAKGILPHNLWVNLEPIATEDLRLRPGQGRRLSGRRLAFPLLGLSCALLLPVPAGTKGRHSLSFVSRADAHPDRMGAGRVNDRSYITALSAANRFLQAWQNQDRETGLLMLTDDAKQQISQDRLEAFFSSGTDAAYEIVRGKKIKVDRYAFPVTLFPFHSSAKTPDRPLKSEIVVVRAGKDEWAIDRLP
jgi:hypothetical protein